MAPLRRCLCMTFLAAVLQLTPASATGQGYPAKLFDQTTFGYARIDVDRFDVDATFEMLKDLTGDQSQWNQMWVAGKPAVGDLVAGLKQAGCREVLVVISLSDLPTQAPIVFVPASPERRARIEAQLQSLADGYRWTVKPVNEGLVIAADGALARIAGNTESSRDIHGLLDLSEGYDLAAVLAMSNDQRRVLLETLPAFPQPFDAIDGRLLADGASTIVVGINPGADEKLTMSVSGDDEEANTELSRQLGQIATHVAGDSDLPRWLRLAGKMYSAASVRNTDYAFSIHFSGEDGSYDKLSELMNELIVAYDLTQRRVDLSNQVRQLVLACHNFHDANKSFPAYASMDANGNPLLSWRVHILPFLGENDLYEQFRLNEPWDSDHNKQLIDQIPDCYRTSSELTQRGQTAFVIPFGQGVVGGQEGMSLAKIADGTSQTILIAMTAPEAAVVWTKPADLNVDLEKPLQGLLVDDQNTILVGFADGSVHRLEPEPKLIRARLTVDGRD